jgi:DNA-binding GntR family transcriptional regulator
VYHEGVEKIAVQRFLTKADSVAEWVRSQILYGTLAPGTRLQQEEIAGRLGVSSTPVREAFGTLEAEGLLEREPHHGVVVARRDAADVEELNEVRALIEVLAIRRAVQRLPGVNFAEVEQYLAEGHSAIEHGDVQAFRLASRNFHFALVRASDSKPLHELLAVISARPILNAPLDAKRMLRAQRTHAQILAAIKRGDEDRAVTLISRHDHWYEMPAAAAPAKRPARRAR